MDCYITWNGSNTRHPLRVPNAQALYSLLEDSQRQGYKVILAR